MTSASKNWAAFLGTGLATLAVAFAYFADVGMTDRSFDLVLEVSGRVAFVVFMVVFIARPLRQWWPTALSKNLLKHRRLIGVAFAGMHFAHLFIIFYRIHSMSNFGLVAGNIPGAVAYLFIGLMFITSFNSTTRALGPKRWRLLHTVGLYYIFLIFDLAVMLDLKEYYDATGMIDRGGAAVLALAMMALAIRMTPAISRLSK